MKFNQVLGSARTRIRDQQPVTIPDGWAQGRATFGGMAAALVYEAIAAEIAHKADADIPLRSLTISFVAPAEVGDLHTAANILRAGRSAVQVEARATQGEQTVTAALASFGHPRTSSIAVTPGEAPQFTAPDACEALPYIEGLVPEFTRHFDYRIAAGGMPFSGSREPKLGGWVRFREATGPVSTSHLLALIDAWPPAVLPMLQQLAPASSLTWTLEVLPSALAKGGAGEDWWQYLAEVEQADDGYGFIQARLWDAQGNLVALSRQTVTVFG